MMDLNVKLPCDGYCDPLALANQHKSFVYTIPCPMIRTADVYSVDHLPQVAPAPASGRARDHLATVHDRNDLLRKGADRHAAEGQRHATRHPW